MTNPTAHARVRLGTTVLDTPDPAGLARFYAALLGLEVAREDHDWVSLSQGLAFQLATDHRPPTWPDPEVPQQFHLDLGVGDLEGASAYAESLGATRVPDAGVAGAFVVFLDPSGHPFCLCSEEELSSSNAEPSTVQT